MTLLKRVEDLHAEEIVPPDEPSPGIFGGIKASMEEEGWVGRPIVAIRAGDGRLLALTGSNRIEAAKELGVLVPTIILTKAESAAAKRTGYGRGGRGEHIANPFAMADELEDAGFKAIADLIHLDEVFHDDPDLEDDPEALVERGVDQQVVDLIFEGL